MRFLLLCCLSFLLTSGLWCQTDNIIQFIDQETLPAGQSTSQGNVLVTKIISTSDGGSLMLGSYLNQFQDRQAYAWKLDALGNEQWSVEQGPASGSNDRFTSAVEMNGEFFLAAELDTDDVPNRRAAIYHYSSSGFLIDTYSYNDLQGNPVQIRTIAVGNNNQLMLGGFYNDVANNNRETGFADRLQVNQFGIFEVPGALINFGLGYVVTRILKNGPGIYSMLYGAINPNEEGCGVEFILRSDLVVSKRDQSLNEIATWVVGGVTADYFIDATVRPDGRLAALGFTFCVGELGNTGPLNVAADGAPFWIAELDIIGETGIINARSTLGAFPSAPGNGFESPFAIEYSDCEPSGYLVAAQFYEEGDPSVQYMDVYDLADGSSENYYAQTAGPNDLYAMRDFTRILNGNFHVAGDLQSLGGTAIVTHLTSDLCTEPINCEAFTSIEGCGNTLVGNLSTQDNLLNSNDYSCSLPSAGDYNGPDRVYRYEHFVGRDFGATLTSTQSNLSLFLFDECPANPGSSPYNCVANSQNAVGVGGLDFENIWLENLEPGTYYLVVDGVNNDQTGSYELTINCASGYFCEFLDEYTPIQCGDVLTGDNLSANDYTNLTSNYCGTVGDSSVPPNTGLTAPEHLYRTDIVVGGDYTFELTPQNAEDDFEMYILIAGGGLIDDIFLDFCGDYRWCIGQAAATGPGGTETMTVTLESNESYVIVVDGKLGSEGFYTLSMGCPPNCDLIVYELDCPNLDFYTDASGQHIFTADDPNFTFDFEWQIDGQPLSTVAIDATADIFSLRADLSTYASSDGSVEVCFPRLDDEGCVGYCCQVVCDESIIEPYTLSYQYADEGFVFTIEGNGVSQPSWYYFPNGDLNPTQLGSGFTTFLDLLPQCEVETLYVRYFDTTTNCWRTVSGDFFICDPYLCDEIELDYDFANNAYIVTWDAPVDADNVTWVDDITGEVLATNELSLTFTTDGICTDRFISVRYRDGNGVFRICCLAFFQCDPTTCNALDIGYNEGTNNFDFTLNPIGTVTDIVWINDETGEIFATDVLTASLPYDGDCRQRQITVRYVDENGVTRVCCPFYDYCVEDDCVDIVFFQDCETIDFVPNVTPNTFGWVTTEMNLNPIETEWRINGQPASETAFFYTLDTDPIAGTNTLEIAFTPDQNDEYNICYPYEDENGCLNYCCANYCINVIVEPFEFDVSFNEVQNGFDFNLTGAAVSDVTWFYSLFDTATVEFANGPTSFLELPQECEVTTIYARYFDTASNCWRIVSQEVFLCNPYLCGDLEVAYEVAGNEFSLSLSNADGATNIRWRDDDSGEILATGPATILVPFDGECRVRNFSVRYRDADGVYRICCISFYYCNPYNCGEIDLVYVDNGFSIFWNPSPGATDIVWVDDITGEILSTNPNGLFLAPDGDCTNRFISLRYRDADGVYRICCLAFYLCDPSDCDAVSIDYNVGTTSFDFSFTPNGTVTDIVWINDETGEIIGTDVLSVSLPFDGDCRVRQITIRYVDENGVTRICCPTYYYCDPYDCGDIEVSYEADLNAFALLWNAPPIATDVIWVDDDSGEILSDGENVIAIVLPFDGECRVRNISIRYRDADGVYHICCISFYFCDPYACDEIDLTYDFENNAYNIFWNAPADATDIVWVDDVTGEILGTDIVALIIEADGDCTNRFISVRYRDADGVYRICCLAFYLCDPSDCDAVSIDYNAGTTSFDFSFTPNGTVTDIVWINDETGEIIGTDVLSVSLPFDGDCRVRQITIRYVDEEGVTRICCPTYYYCDPYACDEIDLTYDFENNAYNIFWNAPADATDIVWVDDVTGEILGTDIVALIIEADGDCTNRFISVRYRDADGVYRICCLAFYLCDPSDCDAVNIDYNVGTTSFDFSFTPNGTVTDIVWINDETGEIIGTDVLNVSLPFDGDCRVRQITIRYVDEEGVTRICCPTYYYCDPYDCGDIASSFNEAADTWTLTLENNPGVSDIVWVNDLTGEVLATGVTSIDLPLVGDCGNRLVSVRFRDADGTFRICCLSFYFCNPFDCEDISSSFDDELNTWNLTLGAGSGLTDIIWYDDTNGGVILGVGGLSIDLPLTGECGIRQVTVRFRDANGVLHVCCLSFYFCDPYECGDISESYDPLNQTWSFEFLNNPGVSDITWVDDETGAILATNTATLLVPFDGICRNRNISVYFRDIDGNLRLCCLSFYFCDPYSCDDLSFVFNGLTNSFDFTFNPGGPATEIVWRNDDTGEILATNTLTASLLFDGECGVRNVSVRYRDANGVYRICCCTFYFCDPFECGDITESYDATTSTYTLNLGNNPGVTEIVWTDDETGEILANDVNSIELAFDGECRTRLISVRFRDQNGVYRTCCLSFYFCNPYDCNSLAYTFDAENQNFNFSFAPGGAVTDITWRDDDTGQLLGLNTLNVSVPYDGSCNVRNISVRYRDANGVWRICCAQFFFCDPFDCGDLVESFNPLNTTWTFELTNVVGATEIQWRDDDTGVIFPSVTETLVIPFDGDCRVRNISVRFRDADGIYRICCLSFYYCDPYSCDNLNVTLLGGASGYELFFEPGAPVTDIIWRDDLTGEILDTDVLDIFLEFDGECRDRFISVRYRDAEGVYRICCIVFEFCLECELPQPSFIPTLTENILSVENTTPGGSDNDYLWSFGSVSNSTAQNPAPVVLPPGLTIVCLQATNDCGIQQFCLNVVTPDFENDLIFDLDDEVCAAAGEIVDIPVYVTNFTDILNFQFSIEMADLSFGSIIGFDFSMLPANIETPTGFLAGPGSATVVWADNQGETLPNDFVFMTVRVQLADIEPGNTPIIFSGNPTAVYAEEGNGDEVIPVLLAGQVNICRFVDISGIVRTEDGDGIGQTNVFLVKDGLLEATTVTDGSGAYAFLDLEEGHDYSVEPIKDINYLNGVNAGDLTRISSHVLNETLLVGPYKRIAADVRPPNSINSGDISRIRQLVLGDVPTFVDVDSWTFVVAEHVFSNPNEPTATPFPRAAIFNNLTGADIVQDFIGMKMGDVNNSSNPLNFQGGDPDFVGNDDLTFAFQSSTVAAANSTYTVDVTALAFTDMIAAQMSIQWDSSQLAFSGLTDLNAELELGAPNFSFNRVDNGLLPWVWFATDAAKTLPDSTVLFRIEFEVLAQNGDQVAINFGSNPTVPYFEDLSMELFPTYEQWLVAVGGPTSTTEVKAFADWNLYPNPTTGHFYLSSDDLTQRLERVELYHTNGSLLKSWSEVDPGQRFDLDRLPAAVYLVRLIDGQRSRMIRLVVR